MIIRPALIPRIQLLYARNIQTQVRQYGGQQYSKNTIILYVNITSEQKQRIKA